MSHVPDRDLSAYLCCRSTARACQLTRGLLPMLATPGPNGDAVLESAIVAAATAGLVAPRHHVVVLQQVHDDFCVKVGLQESRAAATDRDEYVRGWA